MGVFAKASSSQYLAAGGLERHLQQRQAGLAAVRWDTTHAIIVGELHIFERETRTPRFWRPCPEHRVSLANAGFT